MSLKHSIAIAILAAVWCAGPAAAATPQAQAAYDQAFAAMMADVGNLDKTFAYANAAVEVEDYEGAVAALERMLLLKPDLPVVRMQLGVLYFRLGSFEMSRAYLTSVRDYPDVPPNVIAQVDKYLASIDERTTRHKLSGSIYAGLRFDSNANSAPTAGPVKLWGGDWTLTEGTAERDISAFTAVSLQHVYDLQTQDGATWENELNLFGSRYRRAKSVNLNYVTVNTGPRLALMPSVLGKATIRPYLNAEHVGLRNDPYYYSWGSGAEVTVTLDERTVVNTGLELRQKYFHQSSTNSTANEEDGSEFERRIQVQRALSETVSGNLGASLSDTFSREAWESSRKVEISGGLTLQHDAPPGLATALPWASSVSLARAYTEYRQPNPTIDAGTTRHDRDWRLTLSTTAPIDEQWAIMGSAGRNLRSSTLRNFQYDNTFVSLGALWRF